MFDFGPPPAPPPTVFEGVPDLPDPNEAPFRPFTPDEVTRLTGVPVNVLEAWLKTSLDLRLGDDRRTRGLDYMQTFAVFAGTRWLEGGAGPDRAVRVVRFCAALTEDALRQGFAKGNTFPQYTDDAPKILVRAPKGKVGDDLNLRTLYRAFRAALKRHFPSPIQG